MTYTRMDRPYILHQMARGWGKQFTSRALRFVSIPNREPRCWIWAGREWHKHCGFSVMYYRGDPEPNDTSTINLVLVCSAIKATVTRGLCTKRWRWRKAHCAPESPTGARGQHEIENRKIVNNTHSNLPEYCCTCTEQLIPVWTLFFSLSRLQTGSHASLSLPS